ncbi:tetratricopeptide repeat protein [Stratiformator vulcanicus]|uniref:Tetratricopeptide repeat protein n=1 Tax=Stratiformator vulcanicus TaxID=2527980 RepID=A0A517R1U4_9PLAN|nr:tetratricopeptide repeat protein [Stratiformator vulcanicus]QDT37814.1 Tetratricopeptide repeat protein [Stratiformator vulcanicus]
MSTARTSPDLAEPLDEAPGLRISGKVFVIAFLPAVVTIVILFSAIASIGVTPQQRNYAQANLVNALTQLRNERYDRAIELLDRALAANPRLNSAYGWRGEAYLALGEPKRAIRDFSTAITRESDVAVNLGGRGAAGVEAKLYSEAITDLRGAIARLEKRDPESLILRGPTDAGPDPLRRSIPQLEALLAVAINVSQTSTPEADQSP